MRLTIIDILNQNAVSPVIKENKSLLVPLVVVLYE